MPNLQSLAEKAWAAIDSADNGLDALTRWLTWVLHPLVYLGGKLWLVRVSVASVVGGILLMTLGQVQDLFIDRHLSYAYWLGFFAIVTLFWAVPVHYAARLALLDRAGGGVDPAGLDLWLPRFLGALTFFAILVGAWLTYLSVSEVQFTGVAVPENKITEVIIFSLISLALYIGYVLLRRRLIDAWTDRVNARPVGANQRTLGDLAWAATPWLYAILTVAFFCWAIFAPFDFAIYFGRLAFVPMLFGGFVPIVGYLAIMTNRIRFPMLALVLAIFVLLGANGVGFHDIRTLSSNGASAGPAPRQISDIDNAIDRWMAANGCVPPTKDSSNNCPPPIIVAAEGGASRAAFQAATVIGALLDATSDANKYHPASKAIFALSGVSGGAMAVGTVRAALLDGVDGKPPCKPDGSLRDRDLLWFRDVPPGEWNWRECLQALTTGDYLTPAFVGLGFRDWFLRPFSALMPTPSPGQVSYRDRSILLEQAMERNYNLIVNGKAKECGSGEGSGLCRAFGYVDLKKDPWLPLLFLNGTTVERGRQLVASDIRLSSQTKVPRATFSDFMPAALDLFEVLASRKMGDNAEAWPEASELAAAPDVRMSTAMVMSARFPLVTTEGNLIDKDKEVAARVVDGGYFDNSGLVTAQYLVAELRRRKLTPIVVRLSNDPQLHAEDYLGLPGRKRKQGPFVESQDSEDFLSKLVFPAISPLLALNNAREGHTELERLNIYLEVNDEASIKEGIHNYYLFGVDQAPVFDADAHGLWCDASKPAIKMDTVSMSLWLSPIVQQFLDFQLCANSNHDQFDELVHRLSLDYVRRASGGAGEPGLRDLSVKIPMK